MTALAFEPNATAPAISIISRTRCSLKATTNFSTATIRASITVLSFNYRMDSKTKARFIWPSIVIMACISASATDKDLQTGNGDMRDRPAHETPTYLRDVQPIFMRRCSRCHNTQARFVYDWLDYKTAYGDRHEIKRRLWDSWKGTYFKESMPISNSPESLMITDAERALIRDWVAAGSPRGVPLPPGGPKSKAERI